ncbi:M56 family metallopeptidase [Kordia zhangzhouensis]|uniref:M56 family metallopeptidase n=1 Tax=Kordia zhangzhouensis TaxID=1620405 RepID=UPI0009E58770|nr:M56 family metallopeptidase [Kordia zhangzhouensis]
MISYIIKSGLCLAIVWMIYKLLLERERMYQFNRYYLLFGLCFSLTVPLMTITSYETVSVVEKNPIAVTPIVQSVSTTDTPEITASFHWTFWLAVIYGIGGILLTSRFVTNLFQIFHKITKNIKVLYNEASLVLLKEHVLPHSFLHYIFLDEKAHQEQQIAEELYTHELAHVRQKHTLDIICIELIQILFWFNPLVIFYKKAMQLNHEFLADEAVLKSNPQQVWHYQQLLLEKVNGNRHFRLASNFNFSVTKKRLQMMTKHTSRERAWFFASLTLPVFISAFFLFSTKIIAQKDNDFQKISKESTVTQDSKATFYEHTTFIVEDENGTKLTKTYDELSSEQQTTLLPLSKKTIATPPSKKLLNEWKNRAQFAIWIDGKSVNNTMIDQHTIVHYTSSFVHKNARSKKFPQSYQVQLYTQTGFDTLQKELANPLHKGTIIHINKKTSKKSPVVIKKKSQKNKSDIVIMINKSGKYLVNYEHIGDFTKLDSYIKIELKKILHKRARRATIIFESNQKSLVDDVRKLLNTHKIYEIYTIDAANVPPPPPPPPAPKKTTAERDSVFPSNEKAVEIMQKITKGESLKTMMINGKKYTYVIKKGRKFIFNEDSRLVDDEGNLLPPPPPPAPKPEKPQIKEIRVPTPKKSENNKKDFPKVEKEANNSENWKEVTYFLNPKQQTGSFVAEGEAYYYAINAKTITVYNRYGQKLNSKDEKFQKALSKLL